MRYLTPLLPVLLVSIPPTSAAETPIQRFLSWIDKSWIYIGGVFLLVILAYIIKQIHFRRVTMKITNNGQSTRILPETYREIIDTISQFRPSVPVNIQTIATKAKVTPEQAEIVINSIIDENPQIGEYLDLEKVFIAADDSQVLIDQLLKKFGEIEGLDKL